MATKLFCDGCAVDMTSDRKNHRSYNTTGDGLVRMMSLKIGRCQLDIELCPTCMQTIIGALGRALPVPAKAIVDDFVNLVTTEHAGTRPG